MSNKNIDKYVMDFFDDTITALTKWDKYIRDKFMGSAYADSFYKDYYKGLGAWSITERFIEFLIYIELCGKYRICPEDSSYSKLKRLDLALYVEVEDESYVPEVAIELKWAGFTKNGLFNRYTFNRFKEDFKKIKKAPNPNKYIIQFGITEQSINSEALMEQISELDGRMLRVLAPKILKISSFPTLATDDETNFVLILWSVSKKAGN